jgi:hypothetical protein
MRCSFFSVPGARRSAWYRRLKRGPGSAGADGGRLPSSVDLALMAPGLRRGAFQCHAFERLGVHAYQIRACRYDAKQMELVHVPERQFMQIPLQISCEHADLSERAAIEHEAERLEEYQHHITGCHQHLGDDSASREYRRQPPT